MVMLARKLGSLPEPFAPAKGWAERGIALTCSSSSFDICLFNVRMIREIHRVDLPIEVWSSTGDLTFEQRERLLAVRDSHGAPPRLRVVNEIAADYIKWFGPARRWTPRNWNRNFHYKIMALLGSEFAQVLLLDDDNVPVRDPAALFETEEFARAGTVLWPDMYMLPASSAMWQVFGLRYRPLWAGESGAVLVDKRRAYSALMLLALVNQHQDFYYKLTYFDKDTFLYAWMATGDAFVQVPYAPVPVGSWHRGRFCGHSFGQSDLEGRLAFVHMTHNKRLDKRLNAVKYFDPEAAEQTHAGECMDAVPRARDAPRDAVQLVDFESVIGNFARVSRYLRSTA
eukprot:m51a1_g13480 hypothetical protein (341) ;mRNA; r:819-2079